MSLFYKEEHATCYNYRLASTANFVVHTFPVANHIYEIPVNRSTIVFILSGDAEVTCNNFKNIRHHAGEMLLLPRNSCCYANVLEECTIITCAFLQSMSFCNRFSFEKLTKHIPAGYIYEGKILPICDRIMDFLRLLQSCLSDGLQCGHFHEIKSQELFIYFRAYYSKSDLAEFFCPLLGEDMDFKDLILANWQKVDSVEEFATMSNMSLSTFKRRFKAAFGKTAKEWLLTRKAEMLYRDVLISKMNLTEIASKYHFSSQGYLCNFCKKYYGLTPHEIRNLNDLPEVLSTQQNCRNI